jgi:hypothetical protein
MTIDDVLLHVSDRVARLVNFFVSVKIHWELIELGYVNRI